MTELKEIEIEGIFRQIHFESDFMQVLSLSPNKKEFEFPLKTGPINFSVLRSDGLLSNRWGVTRNNKGDAYVYCRDNPNAEKISLHVSRRQHISIRSETAKRIGAEGRFGNVWSEPEFEGTAIATFSLVFPPWGVGIRPNSLGVKRDEFLIVGHREKLVVVSFFIVDSDKKMQGSSPHFVLGQLPLRPGKTLYIIALKEQQNNLKDRIRGIFPHVSHSFYEMQAAESDYTLCVQGYRGPNSAYIVTVPVHYTPPSDVP